MFPGADNALSPNPSDNQPSQDAGQRFSLKEAEKAGSMGEQSPEVSSARNRQIRSYSGGRQPSPFLIKPKEKKESSLSQSTSPADPSQNAIALIEKAELNFVDPVLDSGKKMNQQNGDLSENVSSAQNLQITPNVDNPETALPSLSDGGAPLRPLPIPPRRVPFPLPLYEESPRDRRTVVMRNHSERHGRARHTLKPTVRREEILHAETPLMQRKDAGMLESQDSPREIKTGRLTKHKTSSPSKRTSRQGQRKVSSMEKYSVVFPDFLVKEKKALLKRDISQIKTEAARLNPRAAKNKVLERYESFCILELASQTVPGLQLKSEDLKLLTKKCCETLNSYMSAFLEAVDSNEPPPSDQLLRNAVASELVKLDPMSYLAYHEKPDIIKKTFEALDGELKNIDFGTGIFRGNVKAIGALSEFLRPFGAAFAAPLLKIIDEHLSNTDYTAMMENVTVDQTGKPVSDHPRWNSFVKMVLKDLANELMNLNFDAEMRSIFHELMEYIDSNPQVDASQGHAAKLVLLRQLLLRVVLSHVAQASDGYSPSLSTHMKKFYVLMAGAMVSIVNRASGEKKKLPDEINELIVKCGASFEKHLESMVAELTPASPLMNVDEFVATLAKKT